MKYSIVKLSKTQEEISEFFVSKHISEFELIFKRVRDIFDDIWENPLGGVEYYELRTKIHKYKNKTSSIQLKNYPEGFCFPITNFFFQFLTKHLGTIAPGFNLLDNYLAEGGVMKMIWGDLREVYFQTAIQLGGWYIDVAYDAIDRNKPKIRCAKFDESGFKDITSIEQYFSIKEQYHEGKMYLNTIFPKLFKSFPFLFVQHNGKLMFDDNKTLKSIIHNNSFAALKKHVNSDHVSILPEEHQEFIKSKLLNINSSLLKEYAVFQNSSIEMILDEIEVLKSHKDLEENIAIKVTNGITFLVLGIGLED